MWAHVPCQILLHPCSLEVPLVAWPTTPTTHIWLAPLPPPEGQGQQAPLMELLDDVAIGDGLVQVLLRQLIEMEQVYHRCKINLLH